MCDTNERGKSQIKAAATKSRGATFQISRGVNFQFHLLQTIRLRRALVFLVSLYSLFANLVSKLTASLDEKAHSKIKNGGSDKNYEKINFRHPRK